MDFGPVVSWGARYGGFLPLAAVACWAAHLALSGERRNYPYLFALQSWIVIASLAGFVLASALGRGSTLYGGYTAGASVVLLALWICVVIEATNLWLRDYEGFVFLGRRLIQWGMRAAGLAVAVLWILVPADSLDTWRSFVGFETQLSYVALALLCTMFLVFSAYFRLRPPHQVWIIYGLASSLMIANAVTGVFYRSAQSYVLNISVHFMSFAIAAWYFARAAQNAEAPQAMVSAADGDAALRQLQGINETLLRVLKR
jgi:hypothetical protein